MDEEMTTNGPTNRLEQKIDALAQTVDRRLGSVEEKIGSVEEKIGTVDGKVETLAGAVRAGFKGVDKRLADMDHRLRNVHVLAEETKSFGHNVYDSLATLTKNVEEGFKDAQKDRDQKFDVVHKAILHWGERVKVLEVPRTRRAPKRRR